MTVEFVRELMGPIHGGTACLVRQGDQYWRVSTTLVDQNPLNDGIQTFDMYLLPYEETMAFPCDETGEVDWETGWAQGIGGPHKTREDVIAMLTGEEQAC